MSRPQLSVVTSVYNGGRYLHSSLRSVLTQEGVDLELVVIDDGSTDESPRILEELAHSDPRVRLIRQTNQGLTRALIRGCAEARGEFIARHDPDDVSIPGRFARQVEKLRSTPSLALVSCWSQALGPADEFLWEVRRPEDPDEATEALLHRWQGPPGHGSVLFRKANYQAAGGYRAEFYFSQDSDLWLRLGEVGQIAYLPEVLYAFRVSEGGISSRYRDVQNRLGALARACQDARRAGQPETALLAEAATLRPGLVAALPTDSLAGAYFIGRCLVEQRDPRARRYLRKVLARRPWKLGAWLGLFRSWFHQRLLGPEGS